MTSMQHVTVRPRRGYHDAADERNEERKIAHDEQWGNHNWANDLFGLFERITIDDDGMASSAFGASIPTGSYQPPGRSKIPQGIESAINYWNGFKRFRGVRMATGQIIDALKDLYDLGRAVPDESKPRMNAIYQRFFMPTARYEQDRIDRLSRLRRHMNQWRNLKVDISNKEEEVKQQTTTVQSMSRPIATIHQKLSPDQAQRADNAQQRLQTLNAEKGVLTQRLQTKINEIERALAVLSRPLPAYVSQAGHSQDAFFPWFICPRPWQRPKPCSVAEKSAKLNQKWGDDMKELDTEWQGFKTAAVVPAREAFEAFTAKVSGVGSKYDHGANHLNIPDRVKSPIDAAFGEDWDDVGQNHQIWERLTHEVEHDLKVNPQWLQYNQGLGFTVTPAHAQYQNIMSMDDLQHLLRPQRSHYQPHNHIAHEYSGYADDYSRAVVPYGGYIQSESEVYVFGIVMLFVFGLIVCFIWWVLCAAVAYYLVSKETKKKKDIESQLEYVSN
eukprot:246588_1